jgi:hypothetical protein
MTTALIAASAVLTPLQGLWRWLMPATSGQCAPSGKAWHGALSSTAPTANGRCSTRKVRQDQSNFSSNKPLRIVRILEAGQTPAQVGRLRISGRMADVCAELDRLAAREAKLH